MTAIPSSLLRQRATIEPYLGETGEQGGTYGDPISVKTRVEAKSRRVIRSNGVEVVATGLAFIRPDVAPTLPDGPRAPDAEDRFICDGKPYEVIEVATAQGLTRPTHRELLLVPGKAAA